MALWERRGRPVVADSSFYIKHSDKLEEVNFSELLDLWDDSVHLIVPMVVVDELDRLKEHRDRHVRWRAGYTLAVFDRLFYGGTAHAVLQRPDTERLRTTGIEAGGVTIELLLDPVGADYCVRAGQGRPALEAVPIRHDRVSCSCGSRISRSPRSSRPCVCSRWATARRMSRSWLCVTNSRSCSGNSEMSVRGSGRRIGRSWQRCCRGCPGRRCARFGCWSAPTRSCAGIAT
ncbi:PIN domain-containing protein [Streptacidiphilus fuscans]|uniref:PIN domain-containing protein n=1 Tax=Streptacidiphilus fuscans TaxID=2789292 RepID=UPI0038B42C05